MGELFPVVHEDADLLVIDKPAGLVCHPTKDGEQSSLIGRVRLHLGHAEGRLVNRLDRETSGVVLVAKSSAVAGELGRLFTAGRTDKQYLAVVHGHLEGDARSIVASLGRDDESAVAIKDCVRDDGVRAETEVRVLRRFSRSEGEFTLVAATPQTGRKHQIRIHLAHIGHPVVGDKLYGGDEQVYLRLVRGALTDEDRRALILSNHALHARALAFTWRQRSWTFEAPESEEFHQFACAT